MYIHSWLYIYIHIYMYIYTFIIDVLVSGARDNLMTDWTLKTKLTDNRSSNLDHKAYSGM
jgi:hypothetical protein